MINTSSNQKFIVTGDDDKLLKEVLKLVDMFSISEMNTNYKPVKALIINDDLLEFLWNDNVKIDGCSKIVHMRPSDCFSMIRNWLDDQANYEMAEGIPIYSDDGTTRKGWEVELGSENFSGHENYVVFKVRPFHTYYSK